MVATISQVKWPNICISEPETDWDLILNSPECLSVLAQDIGGHYGFNRQRNGNLNDEVLVLGGCYHCYHDQ